MLAGDGQKPRAFIFHYTEGGGDIPGLQSQLQGRHLGVEYAMDRQGNIFQIGGPGSSQMKPGWGSGAGLNNNNTVGMEIIARDSRDITPQQITAAQKFIENYYKGTPVFGHGEVNPGHKSPDEGMAVVNAIRNQGGTTSTSAQPSAASSRTPSTPQQKQVANTVGQTLQQGGASSNAISGIMQNIQDEPDKPWDPSDREFDRQGPGEAGYAHGLYQEGGDNWNRYQKWLQGRDWRDPRLQTQFLMENLQKNYPHTWAKLNAAQTPEQAAQIFLNEYLRPAQKYRLAREQRYSRGVPMFRGF